MTPFSGPSQRSCDSPGKAVPEPAEVRRDVAQIAADDEMPECLDGGRAHFVAAADRKRQAVSFEPAVRLEDDVGR